MSQFRWITKVLVGQWLSSKQEAIADALKFGQAMINVANTITLREFTSIQKRPCAA